MDHLNGCREFYLKDPEKGNDSVLRKVLEPSFESIIEDKKLGM